MAAVPTVPAPTWLAASRPVASACAITSSHASCSMKPSNSRTGGEMWSTLSPGCARSMGMWRSFKTRSNRLRSVRLRGWCAGWVGGGWGVGGGGDLIVRTSSYLLPLVSGTQGHKHVGPSLDYTPTHLPEVCHCHASLPELFRHRAQRPPYPQGGRIQDTGQCG